MMMRILKLHLIIVVLISFALESAGVKGEGRSGCGLGLTRSSLYTYKNMDSSKWNYAFRSD